MGSRLVMPQVHSQSSDEGVPFADAGSCNGTMTPDSVCGKAVEPW